MTTLMRNGRDRRSGEPAQCHAIDKRALLVGTRSADYIRASGQSGCIERPDTWLHPNASLTRQIPLATRASSIQGTDDVARYVHARSEGTIGEIAMLLSKAAITAIESGEEAINAKSFAITVYRSPSERRRAFERELAA
jgi:hypothetical protein